MKRSTRLQTVVTVREREERAAARALAAATQQVAQAERQQQELEGYFKDYCQSISSGQQVIHQAGQLARYQAFVARLQEALERQVQQVLQRRQAADIQRSKWIEAQARLTTLRDLVTRAQQAEALVEHKRDQRQMDEWAARAHHANKTYPPSN